VVVLVVQVLHAVVVDLHREPLGLRVHRGSLGHRPRDERAVDLQAKVEVEGRRLVEVEDPALWHGPILLP
jgi:hypothetical protein